MSGWDRYDGIVADNADPLNLGRIMAECPALLEDGETFPYWIDPGGFLASKGRDDALACGWFFIPEKGSHVTIEVMTDHPTDQTSNEILAINPQARYYPTSMSAENQAGLDFTGPSVRGLRTPSGHVLIFDDTKGAEKVTLRHMAGTAYFTISASGDVTIHAPHVLIDKDADTHMVRGEDLRSWIKTFIEQKYNMHIHPTGVGPSGPPTVTTTELPSTALSANHKVK